MKKLPVIFFTVGMFPTDKDNSAIAELRGEGHNVNIQNGSQVPDTGSKLRENAGVYGAVPTAYSLAEARKAEEDDLQEAGGDTNPPAPGSAASEFPPAVGETKKPTAAEKKAAKKAAELAEEDELDL
tara:strand:- start:1024 stop:1404 length:381 start_codon:yes stop_codon:yes gene_type:complete